MTLDVPFKKTHSSYCENPNLIHVRGFTFQKNPTLIENARYQHPMQEEEFYSYSKKLQHMCQDRIVWIQSNVCEIYITHKIS